MTVLQHDLLYRHARLGTRLVGWESWNCWACCKAFFLAPALAPAFALGSRYHVVAAAAAAGVHRPRVHKGDLQKNSIPYAVTEPKAYADTEKKTAQKASQQGKHIREQCNGDQAAKVLLDGILPVLDRLALLVRQEQ
eukprot:3658860-Amphidinium_carterae.1